MADKENTFDDTENRLASIGQIAAGIAHEIRNPLTAVKGFLQLMQKEYDSRYWEIVNTELDQAISTVQNLLTVSKPDVEDESYSLISVCNSIENTLSLFHNEMYRITIEKRFYNTNLMVYGKRNQLKRALFNLLKNAFEAIEGQGTITLEHYKKDDRIWLIIQDSGKGIPKNKLKLLGTPFFSTKPENGTGLGIVQVYSTFYELGAEIQVDSMEGEGTKFTIKIPIADKNWEGTQRMNLLLKENMDVSEFFELNRDTFNRQLELEAKTTFEMVSKSNFVSAKDLIEHANQILSLVHGGLTQEIIQLAQERGVIWAKSDIPIISKMEWFYALRKVIWSFLQYYHLNMKITSEEVFELADRISDALDNFIIHFNVSFTKYRDEILKSKLSMIDELTLPLIPIFNQMAVLPLIGTLDEYRIHKIEDILLEEIEKKGIQMIYIDLSGATVHDIEIIDFLIRIVDGIGLLGCKAKLTGINAKLAKMMLDKNRSLKEKVLIESTLQQALIKESNNLRGLTPD